MKYNPFLDRKNKLILQNRFHHKLHRPSESI